MPTMKSVYGEYYLKLIKVLPMDDPIFIAQLFSRQCLPGDTKAAVAARATRAEKATFFLDKVIEMEFKVDGSNPVFLNLLNLMMNTDYMNLKSLAEEIKSKLTITGVSTAEKTASNVSTSSLDTKPKYTDLTKKFGEVADWETICPYLIDDDTGQKTKEIAKNHSDVAGKRNEMLQQFLKQSNPTWRKVVEALRAGGYDNLADEIEREH